MEALGGPSGLAEGEGALEAGVDANVESVEAMGLNENPVAALLAETGGTGRRRG